MNAHRFDQLAKTCLAVGSRRWVIGGLLGGVLGLSWFGAVGATHKTGHHCTPSDNHPCDPGQTCRKVNDEWTCQGTCGAPGDPCTTDNDCCPINGLRYCILPGGICDNDPGTD
jgi:hypothetical protein